MPYDALEFDVRDGVAHVTLNRPRAGNSINLKMGRELLHARCAATKTRASGRWCSLARATRSASAAT